MRYANKYLSSILLLLILVGCTVTPVPVKDSQASWDQNQQNSGLIGFDNEGFAIITPHARDRYNSLTELYAGHFSPKLKADEGVSKNPADPGTYRMTKEALTHFMAMVRFKKENKEPK